MKDEPTSGTGLLLRVWRVSDEAAVLAAFGTAEMARQAGDEPIDTPEAAQRWLRWCCSQRESGSGYCWAVTHEDGAILGNVAVTAISHRHLTGWVSYWTIEAARGQGVASTALKVMTSHLAIPG